MNMLLHGVEDSEFEILKGKRQNRLRDEDIDKIVETYQFRKEEERYSKRIPMERIKQEGYC